MSDHPQHYRNSIRLKDYDYSLEGAYFVTIVTFQRECLFGKIVNGVIKLNPSGRIAFEQWAFLGKRFPGSDFSTFAILPNHIHGIIFIAKNHGEESQITDAQNLSHGPNGIPKLTSVSLGTIIRAYKAAVTFRVNAMRGITHPPVWQPNYYEEIITNQEDYENIWRYIDANPDRWSEDRLNI